MLGKFLSFMGIAASATSDATCPDVASAGHGGEFQISRTKKEAVKHRKAVKKRKAAKIARRRNRR